MYSKIQERLEVLALGMIFGRDVQDGPTNPDSVKCLALCKELHDWFKDVNGKKAICCRILTKEYDKGKGEHKPQCIYFTGLCTWKVAETIIAVVLVAYTYVRFEMFLSAKPAAK